MLKNFVATNNVNGDDIDWTILEQEFNGSRDSKQIRERWVNHLNPSSNYPNSNSNSFFLYSKKENFLMTKKKSSMKNVLNINLNGPKLQRKFLTQHRS